MAVHALLVLALSIMFFVVVFRVAMMLSHKYVDVFRDFSEEEKGDWGSRVGSTVHAITIVAGMLYTLHNQEWSEDYMPLGSTVLAQRFFSFSCGYFLFDLYVLIRWRVPMWRVFVVHHLVAATPYLIFNFHPGCGMDFYLLSLFLLVEMAVIPLNITSFVEQLGYGNTRLHTLCFYTTYVFWFGARVVLPLYNVYVMWWVLIPGASHAPFCILPATICGHLIAAFCVGVFVFVWTPDMLAKWREPVLQLGEYQEYKLTMRQSNTPRASPIYVPPRATYGTLEP